MGRISVLTHVPYEGPGLITEIASGQGHKVNEYRLSNGEALPSLDDFELLVVMGGPMSVYDTDQYPFLLEERNLISSAIDHDRSVLGICLGAQQLAYASGAEVSKGDSLEVGVGTVTLTQEGKKDGIFEGCGDYLPVFHWHKDTFSLPDGAVSLAESNLYKNQAFKLGSKVYGLQFHIEFNRQLAAGVKPVLPEGIEIRAEEISLLERTGELCLPRLLSELV